MTSRQRKSLAAYLRASADSLGLRDWDVRLSEQPCEDPGHAATVSCVSGRKIAHVQVAEDFGDLPPLEQRHVIAHELAHIHMDASLAYLHDVVPTLVGAHAWEPIEAAVRILHEQGVDGVAIGMEARLPLWM